MLPMNFLADGMIADYAVTGDFAGKALRDAKRVGAARAAVDVSGEGFCRVPQPEELTHSERQAYLHITTNNTIFGTAWREYPDFGERRLVADMSSDFLSHPFEAGRFSLLYAGAQKNLGPAGAAVVVVKKDFLATAKDGLPEYLSYKAQAKSDSMLNTPPVFTVYMIGKVVKWLMARGGLAAMGELNRAKSDLVYAAIDAHPDFYRGHAEKGSRSLMNVTFRLPTEALEKAFVEEAKENMLVGVKGHRSVGGMRASLYNYMPLEGAERLAAFMEKFYQANR
jgi:phosphoserine aminotransferase